MNQHPPGLKRLFNPNGGDSSGESTFGIYSIDCHGFDAGFAQPHDSPGALPSGGWRAYELRESEGVGPHPRPIGFCPFN